MNENGALMEWYKQGKQHAQRKTCPIAHCPLINMTGLGMNSGLCTKRLATDHLSHGTAWSFCHLNPRWSKKKLFAPCQKLIYCWYSCIKIPYLNICNIKLFWIHGILNHKMLPELADLCIIMKSVSTIFKYWCQYARKL